MPVNPRYSRLFALLLGPILLPQAARARRVIPRLPDAAQPWTGAVVGPNPVSILVLGDSTAAGVGAQRQEDALPGNLARRLSTEWERGATWRAIGENGATSEDIVRRYLADATRQPYDLVFVSIGANDALKLRSRAAFRRSFRRIIRRLRSVSPHALILVASLPGFAQFSALPNPLRWALQLHSRSLEEVARRFVASEPGVLMSPPAPKYTPGFFASDRFHPSAQGYRDWVDFALTDAKLVRAA
ncbi:MAG TPA: SGNH/GDSL hydrolase family protein [Galbitalea sp.]|jgi:lysophospholipase L1-like esterase|nr:SGNH/GDSL hydrolase family protein [Galbitalea sp.]